MSNATIQNRNFETIAWGALFIWWGTTELVKTLPEGTGVIGIGLILLGLNLARHLNGIAISAFTTTLGVLVIIWGGLDLAGALLSLPFELPVFAILLIVLGVYLAAGQLIRRRNQ
jgi:hypothetical protein